MVMDAPLAHDGLSGNWAGDPRAALMEIRLPDPIPSKSAADGARAARLWFMASLPPPVDGQKVCNAAMLTRLSENDAPIPLPLGQTAAGKIWRCIANGWTLLVRARCNDTAYISVPGQRGAWMLLLAVLALRLRGAEIWFHHHSFRAINRGPLATMRALIACGGPQQHHILLSDGMRDRFAAMYLNLGQAHSMSNACLFPPDTRVPPAARPERPPTLGHMSVLTRAKGVIYLLDLFDDLAARVPGIRLILAGPVRDVDLASAIAAAEARHPNAFEYRGTIEGEEKKRFYRDIDLFVLPTTLVDEAEPLVMIEAYAQGVDVFATPTGCIPDRLRDPDQAMTLNKEEDAAMIRQSAVATSAQWAMLRHACHSHVVRMAAKSALQGAMLLDRIGTREVFSKEIIQKELGEAEITVQ